jgi:hypothetical protein
MSKQQTAVEWLLNQLKERYSFMNSEPLFDHAKAMEKEQIMSAWQKNPQGFNHTGQQYYQETYGGDK